MNLQSLNKLVINLPSRKDRLDQLDLPWDYIVVPGVENPTPMLGIAQAHLNCINLAKENNWDKVLIMEDDVVLRPGAEDYFNKALSQVPEDWCLLLGGLYECKHLTPFSDYWQRAGEFCGLHFYIVSKHAYDTILTYDYKHHIDRWMNRKDQGLRTYVTNKFIATQRDGFSDNVKKRVDYQDKIKRFQLL